MPKIITDTQQVTALSEIEDSLATIKTINAVQSAAEEDGELSICFTPTKGKKLNIPLAEQARGRALALLTSTKDRLVRDVKAKAVRHRISLDESDMACMENADRKAEEKEEPSTASVDKAGSGSKAAETHEAEDDGALKLSDEEEEEDPGNIGQPGGGPGQIPPFWGQSPG